MALCTGAFVWCYFPYGAAPAQPGPEPHIVYVLAVGKGVVPNAPKGLEMATVAYTTFKQHYTPPNIPKGVRVFDRSEAAALDQRKAFVCDTRNIAFLPITERFFPNLLHGTLIIARADKTLRDDLQKRFQDACAARLVETRGPYSS